MTAGPATMTAEEIKLLPCPFCGGEAEIERKGTTQQSCIIACTDCGCRLETGEVFSIGERWNTRLSAQASAADVLERIAAENSADPATDDLTVHLAIKLAEAESRLSAQADVRAATVEQERQP